MRKRLNPVVIVGVLLYAGSFAVLLKNKSFEPAGALIVLVLFGLVFPALAWLSTRRAAPLLISVNPTGREMLVLGACIVALSIYLIGGPQWVDNHLPPDWIDSLRIKFFVTLAKKVIVFVLIPFAIFRFAFGYRLRDYGIQREALQVLRANHLPVVLAVGGALVAFQYLLGGAAAPIRHGEFNARQLFTLLRGAQSPSGFGKSLSQKWNRTLSHFHFPLFRRRVHDFLVTRLPGSNENKLRHRSGSAAALQLRTY